MSMLSIFRVKFFFHSIMVIFGRPESNLKGNITHLPLGNTLNLPFPGPCQNMGLQPSSSHERKHAQQMAE